MTVKVILEKLNKGFNPDHRVADRKGSIFFLEDVFTVTLILILGVICHYSLLEALGLMENGPYQSWQKKLARFASLVFMHFDELAFTFCTKVMSGVFLWLDPDNSDLRNRKFTLPIIYGLEERMKEIWNCKNCSKLNNE